MLDAGESARFIVRRMVILASEDIGMADPMSLVIANAAASAVDVNLGAIVEGAKGAIFVKFTGPTETVKANTEAFKTMITGAK